ncbi:hypothetical protein SARC_04515 [Sphaeroforma arctica JP610]|uniref:J domain-containing protein n=1 Tax=Sphaeroforma arctica JP610 TaxID=667725 RepID=A0A0L0G276_9EUKA|nr:hypothetical protein SARC_04515 [Sphaeroforma arctica JP610]KNC83237.1 hypothetical protein SARC_04515 [Sphaeroforma arctica JP610]|eukprot:XP_014157139.1 hypothetical protein SARC_04515 [Sphaeroforma arctica JP610]
MMTETKEAGAKDTGGEDMDEELRKLMGEVSESQRDSEVTRVLSAFKLNPWAQLGVDFTTPDDVLNKTYRKKSLMIHPDKCKHPDAQNAFAILAKAKKLCQDKNQRRVMKQTLQDALDMVMHEKKIEADDPAVKTEAFKDIVVARANKVLGDIEWRKRQLEKRMAEEETAKQQEIEEEKEKRKRKAEADKVWEDKRDSRVSDWRSFQDKGKKRKVKRREKEQDVLQEAAIKHALKVSRLSVSIFSPYACRLSDESGIGAL